MKKTFLTIVLGCFATVVFAFPPTASKWKNSGPDAIEPVGGKSVVMGRAYDYIGVCQQKSRYADYITAINKGSGQLGISLPLSSTTTAEYLFDQDLDGLFVLKQTNIQTSDFATNQWYSEWPLPTAATTLIFSTSNTVHFTTTVGNAITANFNGDTLYFHTYTDNRGGIWSFSIDDGASIPISVWSEAINGNAYLEVATGLTDTWHTVVATFTGDDPSHAPTGGTSRGWAHFHGQVGYEAENYTFFEDGAGVTACDLINPSSPKTADLTATNTTYTSTHEFAINARPNAESGWSYQFVPYHTAEATDSITTNIYTDSLDLPTITAETLSEMPEDAFIEFGYIRIVQTYEAKHASDAVDAQHMWSGVMVWMFTPEKVTFNHKITFLVDTDIDPWYAFMLPASNNLNHIYTSAKAEYVLTNDDDASVFLIPSTNAMACDSNNNCVAVGYKTSLIDVLRQGDNTSTGLLMFVDDRALVNKLYWTAGDGETIPSGTVYEYEVDLAICQN